MQVTYTKQDAIRCLYFYAIYQNRMPLDVCTIGKVHLIWQGGDEDIEGGSENFKTPERGALKKLGGAPKICILQNQKKGGLLKKGTASEGGLLKFQALSFNIFIPPPLVILNELSLSSAEEGNITNQNIQCIFLANVNFSSNFKWIIWLTWFTAPELKGEKSLKIK